MDILVTTLFTSSRVQRHLFSEEVHLLLEAVPFLLRLLEQFFELESASLGVYFWFILNLLCPAA